MGRPVHDSRRNRAVVCCVHASLTTLLDVDCELIQVK